MTNSPEAGEEKLHLVLLGSPSVQRAGVSVTGFVSSKAQALLYYLALTGRAHARTTLAALLWGDSPEAAARTNLRKALANLSHLVGAHLTINRQVVIIKPDTCQVDVVDFAAQASTTAEPVDVQRLQAAVDLYQGDFLEGFFVRDAPEFEAWALAERARYRELVVGALYTLAGRHTDQGNLAQAIACIRRLLGLEPWREEAHRHLMLLLAVSGQRSAALAQYETCRQALADELDVELAPETVALYAEVKAGKLPDKVNGPQDGTLRPLGDHAVTLSPNQGWGEAPDVSQLYGRQAELGQLRQWLVDDRCRLVAVLGMGGIGKTAVATRAAMLVENQFSSVIWRSLRNAPPVEELLGQCIQMVSTHGVQELPAGVEQRIALLLEHLRRQRCLLVLDNFETILRGERAGHYLPGYEGYGQLLQQIGAGRHQSCLLLTSREKPKELVPLAGERAPVRTLPLASGGG
jgi:DNA-binding SARP family transcriptional activator